MVTYVFSFFFHLVELKSFLSVAKMASLVYERKIASPIFKDLSSKNTVSFGHRRDGVGVIFLKKISLNMSF